MKELSTPGKDVVSLAGGKGTIRVGERMTDALDALPEPEIEDAEDDPDIKITSPFGTVPGMIYVYRYRLADGKRVVVRYRRDVPHRPYIGEAGTVHHPFVISRITVQE